MSVLNPLNVLNFQTIFSLILLYVIYQFFINLLKAFLPIKDLPSRYGPKSWAVITGASDGIGKGFALVLAQHGLNVCLIARNSEKLEKVKTEIKNKYPKAEVMYIAADFVKSTAPGFFDSIDKQLEGLDVSILVNNVGIAALDFFEQTPETQLMDTISVNILPQVMLTRKLIPRLINRTQYRSAIISVSSFSGIRPMPCDAIYSATKAFNDFFSRALSGEYCCTRLDVLSLRPLFVATPMTRMKPGLEALTPEECVEGCLRSLGRFSWTWGHYKHAVQGTFYSLIPYLAFAQLVRKVNAGTIRKIIARRAREAKAKKE